MEYDHRQTVHSKVLGILKRKRHILVVVVASLIVALVFLHVVFANSIYKAGGFSLKDPLSLVMIGGFLVLAAFKIKYLRRSKNSSGKHIKR
jgi:uncharacterized membrane protein